VITLFGKNEKERTSTMFATLVDSLLAPRPVFNNVTFSCDLSSSCCSVWVIGLTFVSFLVHIMKLINCIQNLASSNWKIMKGN
jgi:hypothetical protein